MPLEDHDVIHALVNIAGEQRESEAAIQIMDIMESQAGLIEIQFVVRATEERFGLHVFLPSSVAIKPWESDATKTAQSWAAAFSDWLVEQIASPTFSDAVRVPYLQIDGEAFVIRSSDEYSPE